nr:MAG TPA: PlyB like endolysin [Caudoviricetes sp.]
MREGIDVSYCQEGFDFEAAKAAGKEFCIVRIGRTRGDGRQELDDLFIHNINAAKAAGMDIGVYFYSLATTTWQAQQEAMWLVKQLDIYLKDVELKAGIWMDIEEEMQKDLGAQELTSVVMAGINIMNEAGKYVGIYGSYDTLVNCMNLEDIPDYVPFFVAIFGPVNYFKQEYPNKTCSLWQYSDEGQINGCAVDLDVMYD